MTAVSQIMKQPDCVTYSADARGECFRLLVEMAPDAILLYDARNDQILTANRAAERLFGYPRDEILKWRPEHFYAPEQPDHRPVAETFAEHVRKALDGEEAVFERLIRTDTVSDRLCETTVVRLSSEAPLLRLSYVDVTARLAADRNLAERAILLATEHELSPDGILIVDENARILSFNKRFVEMMQVPQALIDSGDDNKMLAWILDRLVDSEGFQARTRYYYEHHAESGGDLMTLKNGRVIDRRTAPMRTAANRYLGRVWFHRDITDKIRSKEQLERSNRALRTLSRGNHVVVHARSETELVRDMCRTIVEAGGYRMAWVGSVANDPLKSISASAVAGEGGGFLDRVPISWSDEPGNIHPCGIAVRTGEPQVLQNFADDPNLAPLCALAKEYDFASCAALPLKIGSQVSAVLAIYAREPNAFDAAALELLQELADDLSYGITVLREREKIAAADRRWRNGLEGMIAAISRAVEMRDPYTFGHQNRVAKLAAAIGRELGMNDDEIHGLFLAGVMHDVGKITIPAEILNKPGKLSKLEMKMIEEHAEAGYGIVKDVDFPWPIAQMVRQHHERLNGSGYPQGLKGDAILPQAKILAVADVVDAMMSHRPYRPTLGIDAALAEIEGHKGELFDPAAVDACITLFRKKSFNFDGPTKAAS